MTPFHVLHIISNIASTAGSASTVHPGSVSSAIGWVVLVTLGIVVLVLAGLIVVTLGIGRSSPQLSGAAEAALDRTDARYWKGGFYLNPQDPNLWVPKRRAELGWTINLGHPRGRLVLVGVLALVIVLIVLPEVIVLFTIGM